MLAVIIWSYVKDVQQLLIILFYRKLMHTLYFVYMSKYIYHGSLYIQKLLFLCNISFWLETVLNGTIYLCNKDLCISYDLCRKRQKWKRFHDVKSMHMQWKTTEIGVVYFTENSFHFFKYVPRRLDITQNKWTIDWRQKSLPVYKKRSYELYFVNYFLDLWNDLIWEMQNKSLQISVYLFMNLYAIAMHVCSSAFFSHSSKSQLFSNIFFYSARYTMKVWKHIYELNEVWVKSDEWVGR